MFKFCKIALVLDSAFSHFVDLFIVGILTVVVYRLLAYFFSNFQFSNLYTRTRFNENFSAPGCYVFK